MIPTTDPTGRADQALAPFDHLMTSFLAAHPSLPGASLAVARHGQLIYARGFGLADRETGEPVRPDSRFRIASISKPITASAILRLVEQHRLRLDDPVFDLLDLSDHLPTSGQLDLRWRQITIQHLLHHTAGFDRDASFDPMFRSVAFAREQGVSPPAMPWTVIRAMLTHPLDFDPGTREAYSNFGYCLLGRVLEKVTGLSCEQATRELVLWPLGIPGMRLGRTLPPGRAPREVRYDAGTDLGPSVFDPDGPPVPWPYGAWCLEAMDAHGGWIASAPDLVRFASAFDPDAIHPVFEGPARESVFAPPPGPVGHDDTGNPRARYYACGWSIVRIGDDGRMNTFHSGSLDGTSTLLVRRHDGLTWAVLFNSRAGNPAGAIDAGIHHAADAVTSWPNIDQSWRFHTTTDGSSLP
jgi:N-acyl-D-amino-acid deacylase